MKYETHEAVVALAALAQDTRLGVYRLLVQQGGIGLAAGEIAASLDVAPAMLSFHLKELSHAGLVKTRQTGRFVYYAADFSTISRLLAYLTENCCSDSTFCGTPIARHFAAPSRRARISS